MKIFLETLSGIRYKLRVMVVPISGPSYIYGDNISVIHNTQRHESTLKNNSDSIFYHNVCKSVAMGESLTGYVVTNKNYADLATKVFYGGQFRFHVLNLL